MLYYILDKRRTINHQKPIWWKGNRYGYVDNLVDAGEFTYKEAKQICCDDVTNQTFAYNADDVDERGIENTNPETFDDNSRD